MENIVELKLENVLSEVYSIKSLSLVKEELAVKKIMDDIKSFWDVT